MTKPLFYNLRHLFIFLFINLFLMDIIGLKNSSDFVLLIACWFWIGAVLGFRLEARFSYGGALLLLILAMVLSLINLEKLAEKAAVWCYLWLVMGVIQQFFELKGKMLNYQDFDIFMERWLKRKNDSK